MVIEEYDDQEGGEGEEVEDHTQGEHITRVALPTAPEQEAKRGVHVNCFFRLNQTVLYEVDSSLIASEKFSANIA